MYIYTYLYIYSVFFAIEIFCAIDIFALRQDFDICPHVCCGSFAET